MSVWVHTVHFPRTFNSPDRCLQDISPVIYLYLIKNDKEENKMENTRGH